MILFQDIHEIGCFNASAISSYRRCQVLSNKASTNQSQVHRIRVGRDLLNLWYA